MNRKDYISGEGVFEFYLNGELLLKTESWEHGGNMISPKIYNHCIKTTMALKGKEAIYIPDEQTNKRGIFVHEGENQLWSEGCICITKPKMDELLRNIPKEEDVITIKINNPR